MENGNFPCSLCCCSYFHYSLCIIKVGHQIAFNIFKHSLFAKFMEMDFEIISYCPVIF